MSSKGKPKDKEAPGKIAAAGAGTPRTGAETKAAEDKKPGKGHRQKGAGTVVKSKGELTVQGLTLKEWERTPMTLINEYCQHNKRPKPLFEKAGGGGKGCSYRLVLQDPKRPGSDKDLVFAANRSFDDEMDAKHTVALLALHHLEGSRPYERKLPEPYRTLWVTLSSGSAGKEKPSEEPPAPVKAAKEAKAASIKAETDTSSVKSAAVAETPAPAAAKAEKAALDVRLKDTTVSKADKARIQHVAEQRKRERENRRRARIAGLQARNQDALVCMSEEMRERISTALRAFKSLASVTDRSHLAELSEDAEDELESRLLFMGFSQQTAEDAIDSVVEELSMEASLAIKAGKMAETDYDNDTLLQKALDWICLHVPHHELPDTFKKDSRRVGVGRGAMATTAKLKAGFVPDPQYAELVHSLRACRLPDAVIEKAITGLVGKHGFDELATLYLAAWATFVDVAGVPSCLPELLITDPSEVVREEIEALSAIYGDDCIIVRHPLRTGGDRLDGVFSGAGTIVEFSLKVPPLFSGGDAVRFRFLFLESPMGEDVTYTYPNVPPLVLLETSDMPVVAGRTVGETVYGMVMRGWAERREPSGIIFELVNRLTEPSNYVAETSGPSRVASSAPDASSSKLMASAHATSHTKEHVSLFDEYRPSERQLQRMREEDKFWASQAEAKQRDPAFVKMQSVRGRLPAHAFKTQVLDAVSSSQVVLISGETGCGKTTQIPQFILEDMVARGAGGQTRIVCTQPRRLAAIGVAGRVADERCETLGALDSAVGYQIRGEKRAHPGTALLFTTTGVLLRKLNGGMGHITHIIVDEVHERNVDTDFLLAILKRMLAVRRDVKVILMSATMDAKSFADYFMDVNRSTRDGMLGLAVPVVSIPGFVHPVQEVYLDGILGIIGAKGFASVSKEDEPASDEEAGPAEVATADKISWKKNGINYSLVAQLIAEVCDPSKPHLRQKDPMATDDGAVLVFLPGVPEIRKLDRQLSRMDRYEGMHILHLHGNLSPADQAAVFRRAPRGKRKVVLSTNVAETSLTIEDVSVVIDTLRVKETSYDHINRTAKLLETWTSQASARQRRGRAGRVKPGICYRVVPVSYFTTLPTHQVPEIRRTPLTNLCMQVLLLHLGDVELFMETLPDSPSATSVRQALLELLDMDAVEMQNGAFELTPLGNHMAQLPMDARLAKSLILACILRCVDPVLTIVAALSDKSPLRPLPFMGEDRDKLVEARKKLVWANSDHLTLSRAFDMWSQAGNMSDRRKFADEHGLSHETLRMISELRSDYAAVLADLGFLPHHKHEASDGRAARPNGRYSEHAPALNTCSKEANVIRATLTAGFYPNVVNVVAPERRYHETASGAVPVDFKANELKLYSLSSERAAEPAISEDKDSSDDEEEQLVKSTGKIVWYRGISLERVFLHPTSVNFDVGEYRSPWLVYFEKMATDKSYIRDCSMVTPYALLLFGGELNVYHEDNKITVGRQKWISIHSEPKIAALVRGLRSALGTLLALKIQSPHLDVSDTDVVSCMVRLLISNGI